MFSRRNRLRKMLPSHPPSLRIILLGVLGSIIVVIAAYSGIRALWRPSDLDAFLPAERTAAYFHHVTTEDRRHWSDLFPALRSIPVLSPRMDIGIAQRSTGDGAAWIASPVPYRDFPEANAGIGRQAALMSSGDHIQFLDPRIDGPLHQQLRESLQYRALTRGLASDASWIYLAETAAEGALPPRWKSLLGGFAAPKGPLLVLHTGPTIALRFSGALLPATEAVPSSLALLSPAPEMSVTLGSPREAWERSLNALPAQKQAIANGIIGKELEKLLGGEWSLRHDVLPLLGGRGTVHLTMDPTQTRVLFEGTAPSSAAAERQLHAFHEQFRSSGLGTTVMERVLEPGAVARVIRSDPLQMEDVTAEENGWTVRTTRERGNGRVLVSARRGSRFLIGNDPAWAEQMTGTPPTTLLPQLRKPLIAGGTISRERLAYLTEGMSPPLHAMLNAALAKAQTILWSLEADGAVLTISLIPL